MRKLITLCLAAAGFAALPIASASAHETITATSLPSIVRINDTVVIRTGHRRYRVVRHRYYRHGHWVTVTRRVYY